MKLDDFIAGKKSIGIAGHVRPDGDCVGSSLAVYNYIRTYYPDITAAVYLDPIPNIYKFLTGSDDILLPKEHLDVKHDLFIALDCSGPSRLGDAAVLFYNARETLCIDHHINEEAFADYDHIFPEASSTCELVADTMDHDRITREIAECIYTGMVTDTGVFQYESTHKSTMELAGELMEKGIDYPSIVNRVFFEKSFIQNKITGVALINSRLYADGKILGSYVTSEEMAKYDALPKHMEGVGSMLRSTKGVELSILLYPLADGRIKGSSRSAKTFNCAAFATLHGGGGHERAAGFSFDGGDIEKLCEEVCLEASQYL